MAPYFSLIFIPATALLVSTVIAQTSLNPTDCGTYCDEYKFSVEELHQNVYPNAYTPGTSLDLTAISGMCNELGDAIETCSKCSKVGMDQYVAGDLDIVLLYSWQYTCHTYLQKGSQQAIACWMSLPDNTSGCETGDEAISGPPSTADSANAAASSMPSSPTAFPNSAVGMKVMIYHYGPVGLFLILCLAFAL